MHRLYENKDITVFWNSEKCVHAKECVHGSPSTFDPMRRPWIDLGRADTSEGWVIFHTEVSPEYGKKGIAKRLVYKVTEEAEKRKISLIPTCSYAVKVLKDSAMT